MNMVKGIPFWIYLICISVLSSCSMQTMVHRKGIHIDWKGRGAHLLHATAQAPRFKSSVRQLAITLHAVGSKDVLPEGDGYWSADSRLKGVVRPVAYTTIKSDAGYLNGVSGSGQPVQSRTSMASRLMHLKRQNTDTAVAGKKDNASPHAGKVIAMLGGGLLAGGLAVFLVILELAAWVWLILLASLVAVGLLKESINLSKKMKNWFKLLVHMLAWPVLAVSAAILLVCLLIIALQDKGFV